MTINDTRNAVRQARAVGFSRREILKFGLMAAGALAVGACGGGGNGIGEAVEKFAVGTWKVSYRTTPSARSTTAGPPAPVEFELTINEGGTFTTSGDSSLPSSGSWTVSNGSIQITDDRNSGMASGVPEKMQDSAELAWSYHSASMSVPATWDSGSNTLTLTGLDANGGNFPITAVKQ